LVSKEQDSKKVVEQAEKNKAAEREKLAAQNERDEQARKAAHSRALQARREELFKQELAKVTQLRARQEQRLSVVRQQENNHEASFKTEQYHKVLVFLNVRSPGFCKCLLLITMHFRFEASNQTNKDEQRWADSYTCMYGCLLIVH